MSSTPLLEDSAGSSHSVFLKGILDDTRNHSYPRCGIVCWMLAIVGVPVPLMCSFSGRIPCQIIAWTIFLFTLLGSSFGWVLCLLGLLHDASEKGIVAIGVFGSWILLNTYFVLSHITVWTFFRRSWVWEVICFRINSRERANLGLLMMFVVFVSGIITVTHLFVWLPFAGYTVPMEVCSERFFEVCNAMEWFWASGTGFMLGSPLAGCVVIYFATRCLRRNVRFFRTIIAKYESDNLDNLVRAMAELEKRLHVFSEEANWLIVPISMFVLLVFGATVVSIGINIESNRTSFVANSRFVMCNPATPTSTVNRRRFLRDEHLSLHHPADADAGS